MESKGCNSVSEQLIAAGASEEEEVKKVSQNIAHTVRQLGAKSSLPNLAQWSEDILHFIFSGASRVCPERQNPGAEGHQRLVDFWRTSILTMHPL